MSLVLRTLPFGLALLFIFGCYVGGMGYFLGPTMCLVVMPLADSLIGERFNHLLNPKPKKVLDFILRMHFFLQIFFNVYIFFVLKFRLSAFDITWTMINAGMMNGILGLTVAHELIHRKNPIDRLIGKLLLVMVFNGHYKIAHLIIHHRDIATPMDPVSAWNRPNLYMFLPKAIFSSFKRAWLLEYERLKTSSFLNRLFKNEVNQTTALSSLVALPIILYLGPIGLLIFIGQSLIAISFLKTIDYIEHYGRVRKKLPNGAFEKFGSQHSWDTDSFVTNIMLFNVGRHAHHHKNPSVPYYKLKLEQDSKRLPFGYPMAIWIALIPVLLDRWLDKQRLK